MCRDIAVISQVAGASLCNCSHKLLAAPAAGQARLDTACSRTAKCLPAMYSNLLMCTTSTLLAPANHCRRHTSPQSLPPYGCWNLLLALSFQLALGARSLGQAQAAVQWPTPILPTPIPPGPSPKVQFVLHHISNVTVRHTCSLLCVPLTPSPC
jgi:hypothetical protein